MNAPSETTRCNGADCEVCRCALIPSQPCTDDANGQCACERQQPVGFWSAMVDAFHDEHHGARPVERLDP